MLLGYNEYQDAVLECVAKPRKTALDRNLSTPLKVLQRSVSRIQIHGQQSTGIRELLQVEAMARSSYTCSARGMINVVCTKGGGEGTEGERRVSSRQIPIAIIRMRSMLHDRGCS